MRVLAVLLLLAASVAGCTLLLASSAELCDVDEDCGDGAACTAGFCKPGGGGDGGEGEGEGEGEFGEGEGEGEFGEGEGEGEGEGDGEPPPPPPPPPRTCLELFQRGEVRSGAYNIDFNGDGVIGTLVRTVGAATFEVPEQGVHCDMTRAGGGWTRVFIFDTREGAIFGNNAQAPCPSNLTAKTFGAGFIGCARPNGGGSQQGLLFLVQHAYTAVMGHVEGIVFGDADAFAGAGRSVDVNGVYVDGVSITTGDVTREHVFTLVGAHPNFDERVNRCPCDASATQPPGFVGGDFICDRPTLDGARPGNGRAYDVGNPVWDTDVCGTSADGFWTRNTASAHDGNDDLELRLMHDQNTDGVANPDENIALTRIELYIR